jgi:hypothetical protein
MRHGLETFVIVKHTSLLGQRLQKIIAFDTDFKSVSPQTNLINMQLRRRTLSDTESGCSSAVNREKINEKKKSYPQRCDKEWKCLSLSNTLAY